MKIQSLLGTITTGGGSQLAPPQRIWRGRVTSFSIRTGCWQPATGPTPDSYNVHRADLPSPSILASGIVPTPPQTGATPQIFFGDTTVVANTTYEYWWTAVIGGVESAQSTHIFVTSLAGQITSDLVTVPPTYPQQPIEPDTWVVPPALPTGGTLWTATLGALTDNGVNPTPGTGAQQNVNCSLQWALNHVAAGDRIQLTSGTSYISPQGGGFKMPAVAGPAWVWIHSDQIPEIGGALPQYLWNNSPIDYTLFDLASTIAAGATGCTLNAPWPYRTGGFPIKFLGNTNYETRVGTFTQGSTAVTWIAGIPLVGACTVAQILVHVGDYVTPSDMANMPKILTNFNVNSGQGVGFPTACSNVRFVGIYFALDVGQAGKDSVELVYMGSQCTNVYYDRCAFGQLAWNWGQPGDTSGNIVAGLFIRCDQCLVQQCWFWGFYDVGPNSPQDAFCIDTLQGNKISIRSNFLEASSECIISGGTFYSEAHPPQNMVWERNYCYHAMEYANLPQVLPAQSPNIWIKNLLELKDGQIVAMRNNILQNGWGGTGGHQHGRAIVLLARDNLAANPGANPLPSDLTSWAYISDVSVYNNKIYNVVTGFLVDNGDPGAFQYTQKIWIHNNVIHSNVTPLFTQESDQFHGITGAAVPDVIVTNNTWIYNPAHVLGTPRGFYCTNTASSARDDRVLYLNNIVDTPNLFVSDTPAGTTGQAGWNSGLANSLYDKVLVTTDARAYTTGTVFRAAYAAIGFNNFINNTTSPFPGDSWNLAPSSPYFAVSKAIGSRPANGPLGAVVSTHLANTPFPRTFTLAIGGNFSVLFSGNTIAGVPASTVIAQTHICAIGSYVAVESDHSSLATLFQGWKNGAAANGIALKTFEYTAGQGFQFQNSNWPWITAAFNAASMWAYTTIGGSGTTNLLPYGGSANQSYLQICPTNVQTIPNFTFNGKTGVLAGLNLWDSYAQYFIDVMVNGLAVSKYGEAHNLAANPYLDGIYLDNETPTPPGTATWNGKGTTPVGTNATTVANTQKGQAKHAAAIRAAKPGMLVFANTAFSSALPTLDPSNIGLWDVCFQEEVIGESFSIETFDNSPPGHFMQRLIAAEATVAPTGTLVFHQSGSPGGVNNLTGNQSTWSATQWRSLRMGFAAAMMRNYHFAWNGGVQAFSNFGLLDEQAQTIGGVQNFGWLSAGSQRLDPPQSASWSNGVWRRRFPNGWVLCNFRGNGAQTVAVPNTLSRITTRGYGDATVNTGATVSGGTVTLQDADGIFLIGTG